MPASCGAGIVVSFKDQAGTPVYQVVAGLRSRSISFNKETVDVTSASSPGVWREILDTCGVRSASMKGDGVFFDDTGMEAVRAAFFAGTNRDAKIFIPGFGTFEGSFAVTNLEVGGEFKGEVTASFGLESAGSVTFLAA